MQKLRGVLRLNENRQGVDFEGARAKAFQRDPRPLQKLHVALDPVGVFGPQLERQREQQTLRRHALLLHPPLHFLKQNPLVRCVLVNQHQAGRVFHEHVELSEHSEETKGLRHRAGCWGLLQRLLVGR